MRTRTVLPLLAAGLLLVAAGPAADDAGSSEAETVQRGCAEPESKQYDPPSGDGQPECYDADGNLDPNATYEATHWTNELSCGTEDQVVPGTEAAGVVVSGSTDDGYLQACSDGDLPINGRATVEGDPAAQQASASIDGDSSNQPEQLQGWVKVDLGDQSVSCGEAYGEGGRADAQHPTEDDGQQHCG